MAGEHVRLLFLRLVLGGKRDVVGAKVKEKVAKLMRRREDPSLDRDTIPDVHDDGRPALLGGNRQSEEVSGRQFQRVDLHAVVLKQTADVADAVVSLQT